MNKNNNMFIKILGLLKEKNLTQKDLAEKINITPAALSKILSGKYLTKVSTVQKLSKALDVPISFLMETSEENIKNDTGKNSSILEIIEQQNKTINELNKKMAKLEEFDKMILKGISEIKDNFNS